MVFGTLLFSCSTGNLNTEPEFVRDQGSITINAEDWNSGNGHTSIETIPISGRKVIGNIQAGDWMKSEAVDLGKGPYHEAMARVDVKEGQTGTIELRLDAPNGSLLGEISFMSTGGGIREYYAPLSIANGIHDLYLFFPGQTAGKILSLTLTKNLGAIPESSSHKDERMAWWRNARFGEFIHWGAYSQLAGSFRGTPTTGVGEWIMSELKIPKAEYENDAASNFNPDRFNAEEWASLCAAAGQKYIVITSKHHEGFALFDSQVKGFMDTQGKRYYTLPGFSDFKGSPLTELSAAVRRHGIKFGVYYSILDWHHPEQSDWGQTVTTSGKVAYIQDMKDQLVELMQQCDPDILWFDGDWVPWWTREDGKELYRFLRTLKPSLIINNRVGKRLVGDGDFGTPEQEVPTEGSESDWESCMTMNDTWGFKLQDTNWKSSSVLIKTLVETSSKGGNFLLNVGPDGRGQIPDSSAHVLREIGDWLRINGESIYKTNASCFKEKPNWGWVTTKKGRLYAHVLAWPASGKLLIPALVNQVRKVRSLANPSVPLEFRTVSTGLEVSLPSRQLDPVDSVIVLEFEGEPEPIQ